MYPVSDTDRPLVLFAGMTRLDMSIDVPTYFITTFDAMGNPMTKKELGHDLDVTVTHAFGPVETYARLLGNRFGPLGYVGANTMLEYVPGAVSGTGADDVRRERQVLCCVCCRDGRRELVVLGRGCILQ